MIRLYASRARMLGPIGYRVAFRAGSFLVGGEWDAQADALVIMLGPFALRAWRVR